MAAGARLGPTGVDALDLLGAFALIFLVMKSVDGLGNADGLAAGNGLFAGAALFGIAAFAHQDGLASVLIGFTAACFGFLAFNVRPASLFVGRGGRLGIGFTLAVGALAVDPVAVSWRELTTPLILLGIFLLDGLMVTGYRLRRRRSLFEHRNDHVLHRLVALGLVERRSRGLPRRRAAHPRGHRALHRPWDLPALAQCGVHASSWCSWSASKRRGRGWNGSNRVACRHGRGSSRSLLVVWLVAATAPLALAANDTVDLMQSGRESATRALNAAREGDAITARGSFEQAARAFGDARDKLESPLTSTGLAVPFLASNVRAARTLAEIGTDLANAGESLTAAVEPDALEVVDGRLPVEAVRQVTPEVGGRSRGAGQCPRPPRRPAIGSVPRGPGARCGRQGVRPTGCVPIGRQRTQQRRPSWRRRSSAPRATGPTSWWSRTTPSRRATGGFIGSYALITARDGKLEVGEMQRTRIWNEAIADNADAAYQAPDDYTRRYGQYQPQSTLQNVNLSPDFPSVAKVLESLAPQADLPKIDGVLSVDPAGLAALLELTGPVTLPLISGRLPSTVATSST